MVIGYDKSELESVPQASVLGVGCGAPVKFANLQKGKTVVDLGSGAEGLTHFLARGVSKEGMVIGIDMTDEMLERARRNAKDGGGGYTNVEFRKGDIEETIPIEHGEYIEMRGNKVGNKKMPMACILPIAEQAKRREIIINDLFKGVEEKRELRDGFSFRYPGTDEWISKLSEFIVFERKCCPFLTFELLFASNSGPVHLHIRGSKGAKEFIEKMGLYFKS